MNIKRISASFLAALLLVCHISAESGRNNVITLDRPSAVIARNTADGVSLTWNPVPNARKYRIYRSGVLIANVRQPSYLDQRLINGDAYLYRISAVGYQSGQVIYKTSMKSKARRNVWITVPENLSAAGNKTKKAVVTWERNISVKGYQVRYSLNRDMSEAKIVLIKKNERVRKTIEGLEDGKTYYFQIRAYKKFEGRNFYSAWSEMISFSPAPFRP